MTAKELKILAKQGEGYTLEFKENLGKKFAVEVVAFANSMGGKILIGVDDDGNIIGTDISNNQRANIQNQIGQIEPRINVKIEVVDNVIVVNVPEGEDKPYSSSDGYYLRVGAMCQKMNRNEIREYLEDGGKIQFDQMINKRAKYPEDFDENAYKNFLRLSNISETIEKEELLINLNCIEKVNDKYMFTNAGVIFFAKNPTKFLIQNYLREYKSYELTILIMNEKLRKHLTEVQEIATERVNQIIEKKKKVENVTEDLKTSNQIEWVQCMNSIKNRAEEIILNEIIYQ
jgi:predicted HTH transcriptional regulator